MWRSFYWTFDFLQKHLLPYSDIYSMRYDWEAGDAFDLKDNPVHQCILPAASIL
jgi:hypothetical protein